MKKFTITLLFTVFLIIFSSLEFVFPYKMDSPESAFRVFLYMDRFSFEADEDITLNISIKNNSYKKQSFVIYDAVHTTFQPVIYDMIGREAEIVAPYRLMNREISKVVMDCAHRFIELSPEESITHSINLKNIYTLTTGTEYRVKGFFFPDVKIQKAIPSENILSFRIIKSTVIVKKSGIERLDRSISPSEIILLFLTAEKNRNWDNYFKYLKLESYINAYPDFVRIYNKADEKKRLKIIDDFVNFLKRDRKDYIIEFEIPGKSLFKNKNIAYVDVEVARFNPRLPYIYQYRYTLEKFINFWLITDIEATVKKKGNRS